MRICVLAVFLGLTAAVSAQSPTLNVNDGNALQRECATALRVADGGPDAQSETGDEDDDVERGYHMGQCLGLVSGVWHTHMLMVDEFDGGIAFCPSRTLSTGEMARLVSRYLAGHPAELGQWDTVLILRAFVSAYPCSGR